MIEFCVVSNPCEKTRLFAKFGTFRSPATLSNRLIYALMLAWILCGCGWRSKPPAPTWFVQSWDDPILTVKHDGNTYRAKCNESITMHPDGTAPSTSSHCFLAISQVGHTIQLFGGKQQNSDGRIVVLLDAGFALGLRSYDGNDTQAPWWQEDYTITSVTRDQPNN
jgi:hypothetical protein